uniref:Uncharacterized protein n=1 Tax=Arundo donax TaxID=35708 RepID=A0A0A9FUX6_ARUDO
MRNCLIVFFNKSNCLIVDS